MVSIWMVQRNRRHALYGLLYHGTQVTKGAEELEAKSDRARTNALESKPLLHMLVDFSAG